MPMSNIFKIVLTIILAVMFLTSTVHAQTDYVAEIDYLKRQTVDERLQSFGNDLLGDSIDLKTGSINFEHVDISIPGNSGLEVAIRRTRTTGWPFPHRGAAAKAMMAGAEDPAERPLVSAPFSDWQLDTPRISSLLPGSVSENGSVGGMDFFKTPCIPDAVPVLSAFAPGPRVIGLGISTAAELEYSTYSEGLNLHIPGQGSKKILYDPNGGHWPADADYVTKDNWILRCDGEDDIIATAPNGDIYEFTLLKHRYAVSIPVDGKTFNPNTNSLDQWNTIVPRVEANLLVTKITDLHENWVEYEYTPRGWPKRIHSKDGREIVINYNAQTLISSIVTNPTSDDARTWKYTYDEPQAGYTLLDEVELPDGRNWKFDLTHWVIKANSDYDCEVPDGMWSLTHPSGMYGVFTFSEIKHLKGYSPRGSGNAKSCLGEPFINTPFYDAMSIVSKTLSGPSYPAANWTYNYSSDSQTASQWGEITNPLGERNRTSYYTQKEFEGLPLKDEIFSTAGTLIQRVDYEHILEAQVGLTGAADFTNDSPYKFAIPRHTKKTVTHRNGDTFTNETDYNTNQSSSDYSYGNPTETRSWSNYSISGESKKRITTRTYEHKTSEWILGLPKTVWRNGRVLSTMVYTPLGQVYRAYGYNQSQPEATFTYHTASTEPEARGTLKSVKDANNRVTAAANWKRGKPQLVTRAVGTSLEQSIERDIDDNGWIMSQTDAKDRTTTYQRDVMGRLTRITPHTPASGQGYKIPDTTINYSFGNTTTQMITTGNQRDFVYYDSMFRPILELTYDFTTAKQIWTNTEYDALGRVIFKSQPSRLSYESKGVETEYDALGRVTQTRENVAPYATTTHQYLSYHRHKVTDPEGRVTTTYQYGWDGPDSGVPYLIRQHGVSDTWVRRNVHGQIWRVDQTGSSGGFTVNQKQHFYYDAQQRLCRTRTPEGGDTAYEYDAAGQLTSYAKGLSARGYCHYPYGSSLVNQTYDDLGRLEDTLFTNANTPDIARAYDLNSNITELHRGTGSDAVKWDYTYDGNDRLKSEELTLDNKAFDIRYLYNGHGHMHRKYLPSGKSISYFNDGLGRHTKVSWGNATYADNASYHSSGALETMSFGNGQVFTQTLNGSLLPKRLRVSKDGVDIQNLYYDYYADRRIKHKLDYVDGTYSALHFYDAGGRLERANSTAWGAARYSYDALGNLREKRFNKNGGIRTVTNSYDAQNRLSVTDDTANMFYGFGYDARGNITQTGGLGFTYDMSDQPIAVSGMAPNTGNTINAAYLYDGHMKRVKSVVNGKTIYNVYDMAGRLVHVDEATDGEETDYLHGMGQTLARIKNGEFTYLHPDHLGSAVNGTKEDGTSAFKERYTPYGEELLSPAANDNQSGFTGHIKDKATGLNYMQARYYDPKIGRFLSVDPVTFTSSGGNPGYFNRYSYTMNDPVNNLDPDGRACVPCVPVVLFLLKEGASEAVEQTTGVPMPTVKNAGKLAVKQGGKQLAKQRAKQVRKNAADGSKFEKAVGNKNNLNPNTKTFDTNVQRTKPDFVDGPDVSDAKSVKSLSNTKQMRSQRDLAESNGGTHKVFVNADKNPKISGPMKNSSTKIIRCNSDGTPC